MTHLDVISIGSAMRDIFVLNKDLLCQNAKICHPFNPQNIGSKITVKKIHSDIGGGGTNSAATFSNMGFKTALLSQVADDTSGKEVLQTMEKFKVNTSLVNINKKQETGYSVIFINKSGDRTALIFRGASDFKKFKLGKIDLRADWFFITSLNANLVFLNKIFKIAQKNKIKIAWNPGTSELSLGHNKLKNLLKSTCVLLLNLKEAQELTKLKNDDIKSIFSKISILAPKAIVCITAGQNGAWIMDPGNYEQELLSKRSIAKKPNEKKSASSIIYYANILNKKVVNSTGAGDAFGAGFVSGLKLYKNDIKKSLQLAMLNSNSVVTKMGAKHGLLKKPPTKKMLTRIKIRIHKT